MKNKFNSFQLISAIGFVWLLFLAELSAAQQKYDPSSIKNQQEITLSGTVVDARTLDPLPGASVYLADAKTGAVTDANGKYSIRNISVGNYLVEVSSIGFSSITEQIQLTGNLKKDFLLQPSILENEGIMVTGVSMATKIKRTPTPVTIMSQRELTAATATNLIDALSKNPGVAQISTGPSISKPVIRGLGYNRVVVLHDGIRQEGQQWGDEHGIEIDEYSVQKVEILKGPASIIYGSDAMAGVINTISNTPVAEGTFKGNVLMNYQTNNHLRGVGLNLAANKNGWNWNIYGSFKGAQDYKNKYDGYVFNSKFNEKNIGGYIGYNGSWGYSHLILSSFNQEPGLITGDRDSTTGKLLREIDFNGTAETQIAGGSDFSGIHPAPPYQEIQHFKIASENRFNLGLGKLSLVLGYQNNKRKEFGDVLTPLLPELYFDLNTITYNVQYHLSGFNKWKTSLGLSGMYQSNLNKAEEALIPVYHLFDAGIFVYTQRNFDRFTISGGMRFDNRNLTSKKSEEDGQIKFEPFTRSYNNISGSAGISYELAKHTTLKFNIARGFRSPAIAELASNGAHEGTNRYEYGNLNLQSETSLQTDVGAEFYTDHVSLQATGFINAIDHFIFYRKLTGSKGEDSLVLTDDKQFYAFSFDQAKAVLYGLEVYSDIHPHPLDWLHIENTFSFVRGKFNQPIEGVDNLPFIPAARLISQLKVDFLKKGKRIRHLSITAESDNTFRQNKAFTAYNTETATKGYTLLNAFVNADFMRRKKVLFSLFISGNNLGDVGYQNHLSRLKYTDINNVTGREGVFNMGRNFSIKLNLPLSF